MDRDDLISELSTFLKDEYEKGEDVDCGEAAAKIESFVSGLEDEADDEEDEDIEDEGEAE